MAECHGGASMNERELKEIWMSQSMSITFDHSELITEIRGRTSKLDRRVRFRNWLEWGAAAVVVVMFSAGAFVSGGFIRAGCLVGVAAALWVSYFIKRYGSAAPDPDPQMSLGEYREALLEKYDRQIRLLKGVKFWYVLPLYASMMLIFVGGVLEASKSRGYLEWWDLRFVAVATLFSAFVWWLNEGYGVRKLRREREETRQRLDKLQD